MRRIFRVLSFTFLIASVHSGYSQNSKNKKITDTSFRLSAGGSHLRCIGPDVFAIIHDSPTDQWASGNTGVIVGNKYVMVIDANYLPFVSKEDIALIKKITNKPVKYLVYTHWHFDHNNGGSAYKEAFPDIDVVSQRMTAEYIEVNSMWWAKRETAENSIKRASLALLEKNYAAGKDTSGNVFTEQQLKSMATVIGKRKRELEELETLKVIKPNKVFETLLNLDLGGRMVQIKDWGRANSPHDATIYLPKEQILFTGDMLVQVPLPYTFESWPVSWVNVLSQVENIPIKAMVLGHGPVQYNHDYTRKMRELLEINIARVKEMLSKGIPHDQIPSQMNMDGLRTGLWNPQDVPDQYWKLVVTQLTERTVKCVRGQGGIGE